MAASHSCSAVLGKPCRDYRFGSLLSVVRKVHCQQLSGGKGKGLVLPTGSRSLCRVRWAWTAPQALPQQLGWVWGGAPLYRVPSLGRKRTDLKLPCSCRVLERAACFGWSQSCGIFDVFLGVQVSEAILLTSDNRTGVLLWDQHQQKQAVVMQAAVQRFLRCSPSFCLFVPSLCLGQKGRWLSEAARCLCCAPCPPGKAVFSLPEAAGRAPAMQSWVRGSRRIGEPHKWSGCLLVFPALAQQSN